LQAAKDLGLDVTEFERDRKSQGAITAVQKDIDFAEKIGISGTPFFIMNKETFSGVIQESFLDNRLARM
jgi:predicted DsbA family dithiol-disulfide isomerase